MTAPGTAELRPLGTNTRAWLQPMGGWGETSAGLVRGDGESLLVDTLWDQETRLSQERAGQE